MRSLLDEKVCVFSVIASKSLKSSLFNIFRARLKLKEVSHKDRKHMFANRCFKLSTYALVFTAVMIAGVLISQETFAMDMLTV